MHYINRGAQLGRNVKVGYGSHIEKGAKIEDNVQIGSLTHILSEAIIKKHCTIGDYCTIGHPSKLQLQGTDFSALSAKVKEFVIKKSYAQIGEGSVIRSGTTIYAHTKLEDGLRTGHGVMIREHVSIGSNCVIGTQAILDGYIKIGTKSMIQSQSYITQSVKIGKGVFIAPKCLFLDNKRIILGKGLSGVVVEDYVRIGGGTTILPRIKIGKHALIGAGSIVTKNVPPKAIAYGVPANVKGFQNDREVKEYVSSIQKWEY